MAESTRSAQVQADGGSIPQSVPGSLAKSERSSRGQAGVIGVVVGLVISAALVAMADPKTSPMLSHVFDKGSYATLIPVAILCMFSWGIFLCWFRLSRVAAMEAIAGAKVRSDLVGAVRKGQLDQVLSQLAQSPATKESPLLRRAEAVLLQWKNTGDLGDVDVVVQTHAGTDEASLQEAYSQIKTFVWALPVLGLIGTVVGIALAVGGFAAFLQSGNVSDVNSIREKLAGVTGGLSMAFLLTLMGLATSLVLMLISSAIQTRERRLYSEIEQGMTDSLFPAMQLAAGAGAAGKGGPAVSADATVAIDRLRQTISEALAQLKGPMNLQITMSPAGESKSAR